MNQKKYSAKFNPQARILELLGDQLIRNHRIALFELVKNAYDADSPNVEVTFYDIQNPELSRIEVVDNGEGMDLDKILHEWLEPATDYQVKKRIKGQRTRYFNRLPIGEKGVGRFAVQKLGKEITLITRKENNNEFEITIDWDYISEYKYLSEAPIEIIERKPKYFKENAHGTKIIIQKLKQNWTKGDIRKLHRSINSMTSPIGIRKSDSFRTKLKLDPDPNWLKELFSADNAKKSALFDFAFHLDDNGFKFEYNFTPYPSLKNDYKNEIRSRKKILEKTKDFNYFVFLPTNNNPSDSDYLPKKNQRRDQDVSLEKLGIGPISGKLIAFDLDKEIKARYLIYHTGLVEFLKEQGGMRVYRDGIRVYDYGEPGNDWLGLDERRFQTPTRHLSNNLLLGEINLELEKSTGLIEKTNREGFVENESYWEFRHAILCALIEFEAERQKDKNIIRNCFKLTRGEGKSYLHGPEEAIEALRRKVMQEGFTETLGKYVDNIEKSYFEAREILMTAVGSGIGLAIVFHEIERGIRSLHKALEMDVQYKKLVEMSDQLIKLLDGAAYLVRQNPTESIKASKLIKQAIFTSESRFKYHNIKFINGFDEDGALDFSIKGSRRMLLASLANIIDNSIYWINVKKKSAKNYNSCLYIGPSDHFENSAILIADNGVGFQDAPEEVVRPFFTRKLEGMGLGLYYSNLVMKIHKGRLAFPLRNDLDIPKECSGAIVAMVF